MIKLQNYLLSCHINNWYNGVALTQEFFSYMDSPAGFLKAQLDMAHCSMPRDKIIALFDHGMIDYILFYRPKDSFIFEEKVQIVIGNITIS